MEYPLDALNKRKFTYLGDIAHEYYKFPGKYVSSCANEYPNADGSISRVDNAYLSQLDDDCFVVINVEDESGHVSRDVLKKIAGYRDDLRYHFKFPVFSAIITSEPLNRSATCLKLSQTDIFAPVFRPILRRDARQKLNNIKDKVKSNHTFTKLEAFEILDVCRMFETGNSEVLEEICETIPYLKIDCDNIWRYEFIFCMRCVIHKYAPKLKDIKRLEEVIGVPKVRNGIVLRDERIFSDGEKKGKLLERLDMAIKIMKEDGIEKAVRLSGLSREEILSGELSEDRLTPRKIRI